MSWAPHRFVPVRGPTHLPARRDADNRPSPGSVSEGFVVRGRVLDADSAQTPAGEPLTWRSTHCVTTHTASSPIVGPPRGRVDICWNAVQVAAATLTHPDRSGVRTTGVEDTPGVPAVAPRPTRPSRSGHAGLLDAVQGRSDGSTPTGAPSRASPSPSSTPQWTRPVATPTPSATRPPSPARQGQPQRTTRPTGAGGRAHRREHLTDRQRQRLEEPLPIGAAAGEVEPDWSVYPQVREIHHGPVHRDVPIGGTGASHQRGSREDPPARSRLP